MSSLTQALSLAREDLRDWVVWTSCAKALDDQDQASTLLDGDKSKTKQRAALTNEHIRDWAVENQILRKMVKPWMWMNKT